MGPSTRPARAGTLDVPRQDDTISAACAAAQDGDPFWISRGRSQERGVSTNRLTLGGAGAIPDGCFSSQIHAQITVTAGGVTVTGITIERGKTYEAPIGAALEEAGVGEVIVGDAALATPGADGRRTIEWCGTDAELADLRSATVELKHGLDEVGAPAETLLEYERDVEPCEEALGSADCRALSRARRARRWWSLALTSPW